MTWLNPFLSRRVAMVALGVAALIYSLAVLMYVWTAADLGIRSAFSPVVNDLPGFTAYDDPEDAPRDGDSVVQVGLLPVSVWPELLHSPHKIYRELPEIDLEEARDWLRIVPADGVIPPDRILTRAELDQLTANPGERGGRKLVRVVFERKQEGTARRVAGWFELGHLPVADLIPTILWFLLKGTLFLVGAMVFWKRPGDATAEQFYMLCAVTLVAFMGGYHWSHIAPEPLLIVPFMICGVLLPAVNLHYYLVFPRRKAWLARWPRLGLLAIYGVPCAVLAAMLLVYACIRSSPIDAGLIPWLGSMKSLIYLTFAVSALWYVGCVVALLHSARTLTDSTERNQVRCLLSGSLIAAVPIGISLYLAGFEPQAFAAGAATWPMFIASACFTFAFAISITQFRLMEVDQILNSGIGYFAISFLAGLTYYGLLFLGTLIFNQVIASPNLTAAVIASTTALLLMVTLDVARSRFKKALDVRFSRNKTQLDRTLQQLSQAVAKLVDPPVLAHSLVQATSELLGATRGAVYLRQDSVFRLSATLGTPPPLEELVSGMPLIEAAAEAQTVIRPNERTPFQPLTPAQRQLQFLGGAIAQPLTHDGSLLAILILGDKGTPYRPDDCHLLASFAQMTVLALESAAGHRTIEGLNHELKAKVDKIAEQQRRILALQTQLYRQARPEALPDPEAPESAEPEVPSPLPGGIIGSGPVVRQLHGLIRKVAATDAVVMIRGESGTGKELLARAIHETSPRAAKPYVKVHCAALSANLLESELFGHVKGAFTGAHRDKVGRFELANGGTLFLDEIGDISLEVQTKLLRVLQERTFERVGSSDSITVDVRILTATHQNLEALIRQGRFREDLFYRLNVFPIRVPPLRERAEDIPELILHFLRQFAVRFKKDVHNVDDEALALLKTYAWPGNIRQLENVLERAVVIAEGNLITLQELPPEVFQTPPASSLTPGPMLAAGTSPMTPRFGSRNDRERVEREKLVRALAGADGNKAEAARALGIARSTLLSRMKKLGLV